MTPERDFKKILILRLSSVGDVVHALPLASAIRKGYPDSHIAWLVGIKEKKVVEGHPCIDEIIVFNKNSGMSGLLALAGRLRSLKYDIVIDAHCQIRSGVIALLSGAPVRLGFVRGVTKEPNYLFMNRRVKPGPGEVHSVDRFLSLAGHLGIDITRKEFLVHISDEDRKSMGDFLGTNGINKGEKLIGLSISASQPNKKWSNSNWSALAEKISLLYKVKTIILWGPGEEGEMKDIISKAGNNLLAAPETNLKQLAALMEKCGLVIGNDSGPLHLASAVGTPVIGLYGPSDIMICGPYGEGNSAIRKNISALDCFRSESKSTRCRKFRSCEVNDCMDLIRVQDVIAEISALWE